MPTQKVFKQRVRARMTKTGESYTAARRQLLRKAGDGPHDQAAAGTLPAGEPPDQPAGEPPDQPATPEPAGDPAAVTTEAVAAAAAIDAELMTSDESMRRATGRGHAEWFALLDAWGATERTHTQIAAWLKDVQGAPSWWNQNITVNYERARGIRARHQMADGFSVSVTRTIAAEPDQVLAAFTEPGLRERWLSVPGIRQRPTRARTTARFDWPEPASRLVVTVVPKDDGRTLAAVTHERIADAETAEREKAAWRGRLDRLRSTLEQ